MVKQESMERRIDEVIPRLVGEHGRSRDALMPILQGIQTEFRFVPKEAVKRLSRELSVHESDVYGVVTFYAQFRTNPVGDHIIKVCKGTACHVGGAETVADAIGDLLSIKVGETTPDNKFTLEYVACLGCCSMAPVMMIDDDVHGYLTKDRIRTILGEY